jgi:hypothetical protein
LKCKLKGKRDVGLADPDSLNPKADPIPSFWLNPFLEHQGFFINKNRKIYRFETKALYISFRPL